MIAIDDLEDDELLALHAEFRRLVAKKRPPRTGGAGDPDDVS
jgi:hypothetical protein